MWQIVSLAGHCCRLCGSFPHREHFAGGDEMGFFKFDAVICSHENDLSSLKRFAELLQEFGL